MKQLIQAFKNKFLWEKSAVGIDIGTSAIKVVKLKFPKEGPTAYDFYLEPVTLEADVILKKITEAKDTAGISVSVSGPATLIRYVSFPKMDSAELAQALKFEAQKHIPFSMNEINLDSFILRQDLPDNKMLVLLAAVKKDFMNKRLKLIEDAGLKVHTVDLDSLALLNAFTFNYGEDQNVKTKTVALLNIGASVSNVNILEAGMPYLSRDIHIGGNNITQKLCDTLGLEFSAAEELKLYPQGDKKSAVVSAFESMLSHLSSEIRISFDYYESQRASSVTKIFLSGGGSLFSGLADMLANLLGIEVEHWDAFKKINIASNLNSGKIKEISAQLAVAVGLALRV